MNINSIHNELNEMCNEIYDHLGPGHRECIYHRALEVELRGRNVKYDTEKNIEIKYKGHCVGIKSLDIILYLPSCDIPLELKSLKKVGCQEKNQLEQYLRNLNLETGFLINFPSTEGSTDAKVIKVINPYFNNPGKKKITQVF